MFITPVNEEMLHQVFEDYGVVQISISQRADHVEAEVQLQSRHGAAHALALHRRCIYVRCCLLDTQEEITTEEHDNNLIDVSPQVAAPVVYGGGQGVVATNHSSLTALMPTTCSMVWQSNNAIVDVFPKLVASMENYEDLDLHTVSVATLAPSTYSTGGLAHGRNGDNPTAVSLVLWTMTPSSTTYPSPDCKFYCRNFRQESGVWEMFMQISIVSQEFDYYDHLIHHRLFFVRRIGYSYGHTFSRRTSGILWILDATDYWRSHGTAISRLLDGGTLKESKFEDG
ncbi:hypothetical protein QYE76_020723 [Lolium multiflorum]|uniref:PTBP1-like RNA recognition motif 2 domain-containing protein n=1 Tax=Lolium multiflorum TaxID=4521 RepID=A0AAD8R700_LOLMU|nr:hypothetical protein QYE76_020723 [Lolium multiflorum]